MRRLVAVLAACVLCAVALCAYFAPSVSEEELLASFAEKPYWVSASHDISKSPKAIAAAIKARIAQDDNVHVLLGSSELGLAEPLSSHPFHFFNEHHYPIDTISIGSGGFQSLFHAIEVGALDELEAIPDRKVALIVSMQWFPSPGCKPEAFQESFSWEAFGLLASNSRLSRETKESIIKRAGELGIAEGDLRAAAGWGSLEEQVNFAIAQLLFEKERRAGLQTSLDGCFATSELKSDATLEQPNWDEWMQREIDEAVSDSTSNDWGIYDAYWKKHIEPWMEEYDPTKYSEPYMNWETPELGDFELFLQVCEEAGVEPLIVIAPVKGWYYDMRGYPTESRQAYYEMMRSTCERHGVQYADYSDHDYDLYFLHDVMHMGCTGWVQVNRDLMDFFWGVHDDF